ncbi:MAG: site-specific DNA-methyltransferase [Planctomycetes bacterium]|nr:site-specific DNA-methyltransferase [Planctomycetota bacterium]
MLHSIHKIVSGDSRKLDFITDNSVDLVVTSPPYPMIEMWDELFSDLNKEIMELMAREDGDGAFELMHLELDKVWRELYRVLRPGGFACINIGDATRTLGKRFQLYSNHSRIISRFKEIGFNTLPVLLWRKQTNAPNKFMGSGMLPAGAYVTLEHEYILIFRKGGKREFKSESEKLRRQQSSFFWEERNAWFSDVWFDLKGTSQNLNNGELRERSGAYPFELAYRLVNMYSAQNDVVLDPFLGTGTTSLASMASMRNSIGVEIVPAFKKHVMTNLGDAVAKLNDRITQRFDDHLAFVETYQQEKRNLKYNNDYYEFPVMTGQEIKMQIPFIKSLAQIDDQEIKAIHELKRKTLTAPRIFNVMKKPLNEKGQLELGF